MPLPLRLRTRLGEPPYGVILRLAARHREDHVPSFAASFGLSLRRLLAGHDSAKLAELAGVEAASLSWFTPRIDVRARSVDIAGERLLLNDWSTRRRRWCPACFAEDRASAPKENLRVEFACWHRALWDVWSVHSCPIHQQRLVEVCSRCGETQDWRGPAVDRCSCNADLATTETAFATSAADRYTAGRLGFIERTSLPLVDGLSLKEALPILERVGHGARAGYCRHKRRPTVDEAVRDRDLGAGIAAGWPESFETILDQVLAQSRATGAPAGMIGAYGWIYGEWAVGSLPDGFAQELRGTLQRHAVRHAVIAPDEPLFGAEATPSLNMKEAARLLGKGHAGVRRLLAAGGLIPAAARRGVSVPLAPEAVAELKARLDTLLDQGEVGARLGTAKGPTRAIIAEGLLVAVSGDGGPPRYRMADVERLLSLLRGDAQTYSETPPSLMPLPQACRAKGIPLAKACRAVVDGELAICGILTDQPGFKGLLVRPLDLHLRRPAALGVSVEVAAEEIGIHHDAARWLVGQGELHRVGKGPRGGIDPASVARFRERYMPGAEVAQHLATSPRAAVAMLAKSGIHPAFGPPACRQVLFERVVVAAYLAAGPIPVP